MNTTHPGSINSQAALAVIALALVVATLFGSPTGSTATSPDGEGVSHVAGR